MPIAELLKLGCTVIEHEKDASLLDLKDELTFHHLRKCLKALAKPVFPNYGIPKDHTASAFQNLLKILGPRDAQSLVMLNLNNMEF